MAVDLRTVYKKFFDGFCPGVASDLLLLQSIGYGPNVAHAGCSDGFSAYNEGMLKESQEPVRELRERIAKEVALLADLESRFEAPYFKKAARRCADDFRMVQSTFLDKFDESARTPFEEAQGLQCAESFIQIALLPQRKQLQETMAKWGPTVVTFPPE